MTGGEPTNAEIMQQLGLIAGQIEGIRREQDRLATDIDNGNQSRSRMHTRLDEQSKRLDRIDFTLENGAAISAQTREVLKELADVQTTIAHNVQPLLELRADLPLVVANWRDLRKTGRFVGWALTLAGGSALAFLYWFGDMARAAALHWLGIPPGH